MLSMMISLLFAGTLIGSLVAIATMLSANGSRILDALAGEGGLAQQASEAIALPRHGAIRADRFRRVLRADRPGLRAAA